MALLIHLRADTLLATLSDNDPVALWPDLSAFGNDAEQAVVGHQPTFQEDIQNGHPAVYFNGSNLGDPFYGSVDYMACPHGALLPAQLTSVEGFIVCKQDEPTATSNNGGPWEMGSGNAGGTQNGEWTRVGGGLDGHVFDTFGAAQTCDAGLPGVSIRSTFLYNPSSTFAGIWQARFNGILTRDTTGVTYGVPDPAIFNNACLIGATQPDLDNSWHGWVMEVRVYGPKMSCNERYDITSELGDYWGLDVTPEDCGGEQWGGVTRFTHLLRGGTMRTSVGMGGQPKGRYKAWKPLTRQKPYPALPIAPPTGTPTLPGLVPRTLVESTTIAAAAFTDTTIQLPVGTILSVDTLVTTAIPGPTTGFSVGDAADVNRFQVANVPVALGSSDKGTRSYGYFNAAATSVRLSMIGGSPATNAGRVRVTISYI